jgi:membrane fusion protein, multidrug efflux system
MADRDPVPDRIATHQSRVPETPPPPKRSLWRWAMWLTILGVLGVSGWKLLPKSNVAEQQRGGRFAGGPMPVATAVLQKGDLPVRLNALGTVTPMATVTVKTQIAGRLVKVTFQEGQMVKEGDLLAEIDARPYQAALEQMEGQLARDQALLRNAETDLARYRTLVQQDSIARQQRDNQEYLVRQYQGTVKADQAMVDNARLNVNYCRIVAPITGRVGLRLVDQGNYVQVNDTNAITTITQTKPITVLFSVPEDNVPTVAKRLRDGATLPVTAYDRARSQVLAKGRVLTMDNQIDPATGTVKIKAVFENTDEMLFPNQFVNVELLVDTLANVVLLPTAAVQRGAPGNFVYVVNPDSTVAVKPVKLGRVDGDRVAVETGVEAGNTVVVDGADRLRDGGRVILPGAGRPGGGAGGGEGRPGGGRPKGGS